MKFLSIMTLAIFLCAANAAAQQKTGKTTNGKIRGSVAGQKAADSTAIDRVALIKQANEFLDAVVAQNVEGIYKFMNPAHIESLGGKDGTIQMIKDEFEIWQEGKLKFVSIKIKPESVYQKAGNSPQKIKISVTVAADTETETFDGELTAKANGKIWSFINDEAIIISLGVKEFQEAPVDKKEIVEAVEGTMTVTETEQVLNGKAVSLPKPDYPKAAVAVRASGTVEVSVVIDEKGDVMTAEAVSGHPLLRSAAVNAAKQAKFSPTSLNNQAVKVTGIIVYNFTP